MPISRWGISIEALFQLDTLKKKERYLHPLPFLPMENKNTITISEEEYDKLLEARLLLDCLYDAGIDNWHGFDYAGKMFVDTKDRLNREVKSKLSKI
jgi:hypothetical protein